MTQEQAPHTSTPRSALTVGQWQRAREDHFKVKVGGHRVCVVCGEHLTCILDKLETAEAENAALETALRLTHDALGDAHDALCEVLSTELHVDWPSLPELTGNTAWAGLKDRLDAAWEAGKAALAARDGAEG